MKRKNIFCKNSERLKSNYFPKKSFIVFDMVVNTPPSMACLPLLFFLSLTHSFPVHLFSIPENIRKPYVFRG